MQIIQPFVTNALSDFGQRCGVPQLLSFDTKKTMSDELDEVAAGDDTELDEKAILDLDDAADIDDDEDIVSPLMGDEFTEDYDLDSAGVNFHAEDADQNY